MRRKHSKSQSIKQTLGFSSFLILEVSGDTNPGLSQLFRYLQCLTKNKSQRNLTLIFLQVENGTKFVILTSILTFKNNYPGAVRVWYEVRNRFQNYKIDKGEIWDCPIENLYSTDGRFYFSIDGEGQSCIEDSLKIFGEDPVKSVINNTFT